MNNDVAIIIQEGEFKGKRLYDESKFGVESAFPSEMFYFYENAVKNNYKIFKFNCKPNHNVIFSKKELDYLNTCIKQFIYNNEEKLVLKSENIDKIKEYQLNDLNKLYSLAIKNDSVGSIFTLTKNVNNSYCFDFILITKNSFDLNDFLKLEFNIFKIVSVDELSAMSINFNEIKKLHDYLNSPFKDNFISYKDFNAANNLLYLSKEYINFEKHCDVINDFFSKNTSTLYDLYIENKNQLDVLEHKKSILENDMRKKEKELWDLRYFKNIQFSSLCNHFIIFDSILLADEDFFTNFIQVVGGVSIKTNGSDIYLDYDSLTPYSLSWFFEWDDYQLFTRFNLVCYWPKR